MSEGISSSNIAAVPDDVHKSLLTGSDVETKLGHVAKFDRDDKGIDLEENPASDDLVHFKKSKENNQFVGLTREELKAYINNPKWKRIRWTIAILYIILLILLLVGSILLVIYSQRCPPKPKQVWYEKDIIYEIDVTTFRDTNDDGIGDIKGVEEKLDYLEKNHIKSILLQSSIFNITNGRSIELNGKDFQNKKFDLLTIDPFVGNEKNLDDLIKILNRKDMHLVIDLPVGSTSDPNGNFWYGSDDQLSNRINNPCTENESGLGCKYYRLYGRLPLNFNDTLIDDQAEARIHYWLSTKKADGVRVNLPLAYNAQTRSYNISYTTLNRWYRLKTDIEKKTKPKLLLIDIPFGLQNIIKNEDLRSKTAYSLLSLNEQQKSNINAQVLDQRLTSFKKNKPLFWQLGSERRSDDIGIINQKDLSKEMILTMAMLIGGTPVVLYGEEIGLDQRTNPLMAWTPEGVSGGFSACTSDECKRVLSTHRLDLSKTSVKRQEALGGEEKDSLLNVFRRLAKLRQADSFKFGLLEFGFDQQSNLFWFIREAPGHRGYVTVFNLNKNSNDIAHVSLHEITKHDVPNHIHYEYQWPKAYLPTSNKTHIDSNNLFIHPQSINVFWWTPKLLKPNILFSTAKQHSH